MKDVTGLFRVDEIGTEHNDIICPHCKGTSKPYGLGKKYRNTIQLVRECRDCGKKFWYWESIKAAMTALGEP
jgi:hypothetical protein